MNKSSASLKTILLLAFVLNVFAPAAQKWDSIPAGVYHRNKLQGTKEETRLQKEVEGGSLDLRCFEVPASALEPGRAPHPPHTHVDTGKRIQAFVAQFTLTKEGTLVRPVLLFSKRYLRRRRKTSTAILLLFPAEMHPSI